MSKLNDTQDKNCNINGSQSQTAKPYSSPIFKSFGDLRDLSKGQLAFSFMEGFFQDFIMS